MKDDKIIDKKIKVDLFFSEDLIQAIKETMDELNIKDLSEFFMSSFYIFSLVTITIRNGGRVLVSNKNNEIKDIQEIIKDFSILSNKEIN